MPNAITTQAYSLPQRREGASSPALTLHVTRLAGSYLLWAGALAPGGGGAASLGRDWSCGMPGRGTASPVGAPILRGSAGPSGGDLSTAMATRLARRFQSQMFLSLDLPSTLGSTSEGRRTLVDMELDIVRVLEGERAAEAEAGKTPELEMEALALAGDRVTR